MTEYSLVAKQLQEITNWNEEQLEKQKGCIENAISCIAPMIKNSEDENDSRIVYLCAVKAYYRIVLADVDNDGIVSFKSGDVSYERDTSSLERVKELYKSAFEDCHSLLNCDGFVFRTV